jgi:hypothetical protein
MKIVIEFYRIRETDKAHAVIGQETADAANLDDAIEIAERLSKTLNMPQQPDAMSISDSDGNELYVRRFSVSKTPDEKVNTMNARGTDTEPGRHALAIGVWENEGGAPASDSLDRQDGWKSEADRSRTLHPVFPGIETPRLTITALRLWAVSDSRLSLAKSSASCRKDRGGLPTAASIPLEASCRP